jgi:alcohol dehydrogenase (cytochrome c)
VREKGGIYFKVNTEFQPGRLYLGAVKRDITTEEPYGTVRAWQALTGELAWRFELQSPPWGGLLATAGDVVFSGSMEGDFFALDALTGKPLWRFQTGGEIWSNPMSYQFEGEQFVSIAAGSSLIVFSLDAPRRRMK